MRAEQIELIALKRGLRLGRSTKRVKKRKKKKRKILGLRLFVNLSHGEVSSVSRSDPGNDRSGGAYTC